jgi:hypothetical protein
VLDFVGALEDFDAVQNKISAIVGRPVSFRYKNNRSSGDNLMSAYDPAAIALVKEIYAEDFDNFGYSTDIADALLPPRHGANLTKAD